MSSDEYFSSQKDHPLSVILQNKIDAYEEDNDWPLEETKDRLKLLKREFKFIDILRSLQSFNNECSMLDVIQYVQLLFQYAVDQSSIWHPYRSTLDVRKKICRTKLEIRSKWWFPKTSLSLNPSYMDNITASNDPMFVKKFIDTVARNLSDVLMESYAICSLPVVPGPRREMEEVVKELKFLRNFVYFISDEICTDPQIQHTFLAHVLVVGGHATMVFWLSLPEQDDHENPSLASLEMSVSFSVLRRMIQPIQPCIRKICIDVLQALKSKQSGQIQYVADCETGFVETLIHCLEELTIIGNHKEEVVSLMDKKEILEEILILLRANLMDLPMKDLMSHLQDIDAIIDAGLLVSSLYDSAQEREDMDVARLNQELVLDFLGNIQSVQALIYLIVRKSFQSKLPRIDGLGSIDIIVDNLKELLSCYSGSLALIKSQLQTIYKELERFRKQHDGFQYCAMQMIAMAHEVEHIVVACINKDMPEWRVILWIGDILEEIALLMREVQESRELKVSDLVLHDTSVVVSDHTSQFARNTSMKEEMVGFDDVVDKLRRKLIKGSLKLDVISIVGMAGLGKTTIARKLYLDQLVVSHFDVRAECCVSQVYTRRDMLLVILHCVKKETTIHDNLPDNELADMVRKVLLVQRYLILVDDVWETSAWDDLVSCFRDANNGSRIILTSRHSDVAFHAKLDSDPLFLRLFTHEESWLLLKDKVFNKKCCPPVLEDVGQIIVQKCGGLPLSVVLVAGILETIEKEKHCWEQVAIDLGSQIQAKSEDVIDLSYQNLPCHLKPCFLYFGTFLEDEQIHVSKLTWLWTAEGLINNHTEKLSEDTAENYLENLIGRNLVMVAKRSSDGKIKACRIHDLLLDFCRKKAKEENFLAWIKGYKGMDLSKFWHQTPQRLSLYSQGRNFAEWSSICSNVSSFRFRESRNMVLSSIECAPEAFNIFKSLRVLDLEFTLVDSFPEALPCLRYVAIRIAEDSSLSFSANLLYLETLIVKGLGGRVSLPDIIWKMVKLRHLHVYNHALFTLHNVQEFLQSPFKMDDLRTLSSVLFSCTDDADNILAKTPNLRKLRCELLRYDGMLPAFKNLTKLEMLKFSSGNEWVRATELTFPPIVKKLTLFNSRIHSLDQVSILPRLEVLKLQGVTTSSKAWEVTDEQFPQLKCLKMQSLSFSEWNVSDDAFPCLEHLVLRRCRHLKEIPSRFEDSSSLKSVEIISCNESLAKSAKAVKETLIEYSGTSGFEVFIHK